MRTGNTAREFNFIPDRMQHFAFMPESKLSELTRTGASTGGFMMKVTDEQIELLVKTLHDTETTKNDALAALIGEGETLEFYRGLVTGLVISHQLLMAFSSEDKNLAQWLSLAAALASEQYLNQKQNDELIFPDWIDA